MIISINPTIFKSTDVDVLSELSKILNLATTERHLVDIQSFYDCVFDNDDNYIFNDTNLSIGYFSTYNKSQIESFFDDLMEQSAYLTEIHKKYLTSISIGLGTNELSPTIAYRILNEPSKIILENATNDWKFIKGIVEKYSNHKKRKSIYKILQKAVENNWIEPENAGGKGQLKNRFIDLSANRYKNIPKFKLAVIFDSDKDYNAIKDEQKKIIEFFKNKQIQLFEEAFYEETDRVVWHMFYKREMENYAHLDVILDNFELTDVQNKDLKSKNPHEYDFLDFDDYLKSNEDINVKNEFPELFLKNWTRDKLEQRCEHHKVKIELPNGTLEDVTEIEQILIKIAKIV